MMKFCYLFMFLTFSVFSQEKEQDSIIRKQIQDYNASFAVALVNGNSADLIKTYSDSSVLMPEHSKQRTGSKEIAEFYQQWLKDTKISSYQKTIFELQDLGGYILEIGNFGESLQKIDNKPYEYFGKYMVLWKVISKRKLTIAAEIWGADYYIDDKKLPQINDTNITPTKEYNSSDKITTEVKTKNNSIKELVRERKGAEHAKMFTTDAIYLTYYTPMRVGIKDITGYFTEHEKPGTLNIDAISIQTSGIIKTKKAIVEFGFYNVDWSDGDNHGNVKGKSVNVWKRNYNGELMLFRQMVNHD